MVRGCLAAICLLLLVGPIAAAAHGAVEDAPLKMQIGGRDRDDVIKRAMRDPAMSEALALRPRSRTVTKYDARRGEWTVSIREEGGGRDLARVKVDDISGALTGRYVLPYAEYPPRLTSKIAKQIAFSSKAASREAEPWGGIRELVLDANLDKDGVTWEVNLRDRLGAVRVRVDVSDSTGDVTGVWTGHKIAWEMARGDRYAFGNKINRLWAWIPLTVGFLLILIAGIGARGWDLVDGLALAAMGFSYEAFQRGRLEWSVPLAVPPLVWLGVRMVRAYLVGCPPRTRVPRLLLPTWVIVLLAVLAIGMRWGIAAWGSNIIDVGYAGVAGASRMLDGTSPYGNMPSDNPHGDTYGPLNYALYVPAILALGDGGLEWGGSMPAARAVSIAADALCILGLAVLGWRWMGHRAAAVLAAAWATYPFTALALASHVNDLVVAAALIWMLVFMRSAYARGALVAVAASIKFVPLAVLPIVAHVGSARRMRQAALVGVGVVSVAVLDLVLIAVFPSGLSRFVDATFGFQLGRQSPFSIWGYYELKALQLMTQGALVMALLLALVRPPVRDARQVVAGMGAALIGVQLVLQHWFYLYLPWIVPFVLVLLVARVELETRPLHEGLQQSS